MYSKVAPIQIQFRSKSETTQIERANNDNNKTNSENSYLVLGLLNVSSIHISIACKHWH